MSLIQFHIFLICCAVIFAFGFGSWEFNVFFSTHKILDVYMGAGSFVAGILLGVYLIWFIRTKKPLMK